jgi:hypothetical protein
VRNELHQEKAARIEGAMRKLADADYEAVIEASMLAGTHWFNIALHKMGLAGTEADIMHAEFLNGAQRRILSLHSPLLLNALDEIEGFRTGFVRGNLEGGEKAAARCRELLQLIRDVASRVRPLDQP